jgi:hypothetical protein
MRFNVSARYVARDTVESFRPIIEARNPLDVYLHCLVVQRNEAFKASTPSIVVAARAARQRVKRNVWYWLPVVAPFLLVCSFA